MSVRTFSDLISEEEWIFCEKTEKEIDNSPDIAVDYEVTDDEDDDSLRFCDTLEEAIAYAKNRLENDCWNEYRSLQIVKRSKIATVTTEIQAKVIYN